jgi:hypothetical protein
VEKKYKTLSKIIKEALHQAHTISPPQIKREPNLITEQPTSHRNDHLTMHIQPRNTNGTSIKAITNKRIRKLKDKWGAQATHLKYLCTWQTLNDTLKKWVDEQHVLQKDNLTYEHNLTMVHNFL